ncbi:MAG: hypothetical protein ABI177_08115 [Edaphobacter sp.]
MNTILGSRARKYLIAIFAVIVTLSATAHAQSYVEGVSEVLSSTTSTDLYTYTDTLITYDLAAYYSPYTQAQLLDNGTQIAYGATGSLDGQTAPLDGHVPNLKTGDDYEVDGAHYLIAFYTYYDPGSGNTYYENPGYYGFTDGDQGSGYDYTGGGGDYYTAESSIFLGYTASAISTAVPQITGISPSGATRGTSGQITVSGSHLVDIFNGGTTPTVLSGSGFSLTTTGTPSATQATLNYSLDASAATGARQFTLTNRFGQSEPQTFTIGDPSPVVGDVEPHVWPAGTVIPLIITGSGFGIAPTVTLAGVGVLNPVPAVTSATDSRISTSVSIAANAPDGPATVSVQSHGSGGNGFVQGTPGQSSSGSNAAAISAAPAPIPQIMFNGNNISGTTQSVMAGQQIALSVSPPSGFTITSQSWSFSNQSAITGGFTNTAGNGQPSASGGGQEAADPSLNQGTLTFYWVNPGDNGETVTYTYTLDTGRSASATATFNIGGPTGSTLPNAFVQTDDSATAINNAQSNPATLIMTNAPGKPAVGIWFNDLATLPQGNFIWVQILNSVTYSQLLPSNASYTPPPTAQNQLDGVYPYPNASNVSTSDGPNRPDLLGGMGEAAEAFDANMYVLWDPALPAGCTPATTDTSTKPYYTSTPSTCTSIPVPLASIRWTWSACAINALASAPGGVVTSSWLKHCGPGKKYPAAANGYPEWNKCYASKNANCQ